MSELPDLHKAMTEALPVYEAPASLQAWAREEARKADQESAPSSESSVSPSRTRVRRFSDWRIAAGFLVAALLRLRTAFPARFFFVGRAAVRFAADFFLRALPLFAAAFFLTIPKVYIREAGLELARRELPAGDRGAHALLNLKP